MSSIADASKIDFENQRILFDTNIWILVYGFSANAAKEKTDKYSNTFSKILKSNNKIVVNDYVLGEFCNRSIKYEYGLAAGDDKNFPHFKKYRRSTEFKDRMESIRDTCLHILDDCEYVQVGKHSCDARKAVENFCSGEMDFSDLILAEYCTHEKVMLLTDDADFGNCGLSILTHNTKLLQKKK